MCDSSKLNFFVDFKSSNVVEHSMCLSKPLGKSWICVTDFVWRAKKTWWSSSSVFNPLGRRWQWPSSYWTAHNSFLWGVCATGSSLSTGSLSSPTFIPVLISWSSTQISALLDFLYCSISSALVTLSLGQEKFLIQAADGELQLTFSGLVSSQVVADIPVNG